MGIHNLETFMKESVRDGFKDVSVMKEIVKFKKNCFQKPILIFDACAIVCFLCENRAHILSGGTYNDYYADLCKIFSRLAENCELVFFMDGFISTHKYDTWKKRQDDKYKESKKIMKKIYEKTPLAEITKTCKPYVNVALNVVECIAKKYGTLKYAVNHECDQEIAQFAAIHWRVMAIFSDDTDFLIFNGRWRYFSMKHLNHHTFQTKEYNRQALRNHVNLTDFQLSIWATCLGNDIISYESVKHFHQNLKGNRFEEIAEIVRVKIGMKTLDEIMDILAVALLGFRDEYANDLIKASIDSYSVCQKDTIEGPFDYLLKDHLLFTRNILSNAPFNFSLIFYDLDIYNSPSYFDIAIPMFQRQAGVVFAQAQIDPFKLNVYCKQLSFTNHEIHIVPPVIPPFEVISMEEIHSNDKKFDDHRFKLLAWTICWNKFHNFNFQLIPSRYIIEVLTLVYLLEARAITASEADIFLLSIKNVEQGKVKIHAKPLKTLDPRAFHIAFLFTRTFTNVVRSFEVCGLQKRYGKAINFNGPEFHHLFDRFKREQFDAFTLLNDI